MIRTLFGLLVIFGIFAVIIECGSNKINIIEYYNMPKLSVYDDYDRCFNQQKVSVYCVVNVNIKPNSTVALWRFIEMFSSDKKHHFRHDRLQRGICMDRCRSFDTKIYQNDSSKKSYHSTILDRNSKVINDCVNLDLKKQFDLEADTVIEYCLSSDDTPDLDILDKMFMAVSITVVLLVTLSTTYDYSFKKRVTDDPLNHYKKPIYSPGVASNLLVVFSLPRNWYRLSAPPSVKNHNDFKFIQAARFFTNFCVMMAHAITICFAFPLENTEFIEKKYHELSIKIFLNGLIIIQSFFTISGFLQTSLFLEYIKKHSKFDGSILWKSALYRYMRLTPVYAYMVFLDATMLVRAQNGPMWPRIGEAQRSNCRLNWWTNLLYINNYINSDEPCIQPTWYLAADFQLFVVGTFLMLCIWRHPQSTKAVMSCIMIVSWIIPVVVNYVNGFDGVTIIEPESMKNFLLTNQTYLKMHIPTHTNLGCFIAGMIAGLIYDKTKTEKINLKKYTWFKIMWYMVIPAGLANILAAEIFYENDFVKPSIWLSVYSSFNKNMWGLLGIIFLIGMTQRIGFLIRAVMHHPIFRPLGRLTYCAFICHLFVLRSITGDARQPLYVTNTTFVILVSSTVALSYLFALVLCLCIEFPTSAICKFFLRDEKVPDVIECKTNLKS